MSVRSIHAHVHFHAHVHVNVNESGRHAVSFIIVGFVRFAFHDDLCYFAAHKVKNDQDAASISPR